MLLNDFNDKSFREMASYEAVDQFSDPDINDDEDDRAMQTL